jgi:hypothetical protein
VVAASASSPQDVVAMSAAALKAMDEATDRVLAKLAEPRLPASEKVRYVRALGRLGTPKAITYLLDNLNFSDYSKIPEGRPRLPDMPCHDALVEAGVAAVPRMVEAYCTWPPKKDPQCLLFAFLRPHPTHGREQSRVAYILAQGYLFGYQEKHFDRQRTLELIYALVPHATDMEGGAMTYPAPWMPNRAKPDDEIPEKPAKKP